jgi:prophage tail gpP-like protein
MMILEVDSVPYEGFKDISAIVSMGAISGSFSFATTSSGQISLPIKEGQECRVLIDETPVITGFVENINVGYDATTHSIDISGRDKTMDVIDCSSVIKELSGTLSLESAIRRILDGNGLTDIEVINEVSGLDSFKDGDIESGEVGEFMFDYIDRYARKRQVLLTRDGNGNILIVRAGTTDAVASLLNVVGGTENNIKSASGAYSGTNTFNQYIVRSQQNPVALQNSGTISTSKIVDQMGTAIDADVRASRILEIRPSQAGSDTDNENFAVWTKNIRRGRAFNYTAVVQGHYQDEDKTRLWVPNELVSIADDFVGMESQLNAKMLIDTVEYRENLESGTTSTITCVDKNAYTIEPEQSLSDARANDLGV